MIVQSAAFLPGSSPVDIYTNDPGEVITMCFPPIGLPTGELGGTVYGDATTGETVPYSLVWIYNLANPEYSFMTLADENGEYYFPYAIAGTNGGWALADGYQPDDGYVEIVPDAHSTLDFQLTPE